MIKFKKNINSINENIGQIDYDFYIMSNKEKIFYILLCGVFIFIIGYIFYHSVILSLLICPFTLFYPKIKTQEIIKNRKNELNLQFKDMLYSLESSISAGRSMETAFLDVAKDLSIIYPDPKTYILVEIDVIIRKLTMNEPIEIILSQLANRSHLEDIQNFADVFYISKKTGGNIIQIIRNTSNIISDKIEIIQEIETLLSSRKFEQKILNFMPIFMILILSFSTEDYMAPVFETLLGRIVMTITIILLVIAFLISKKIMNIKI